MAEAGQKPELQCPVPDPRGLVIQRHHVSNLGALLSHLSPCPLDLTWLPTCLSWLFSARGCCCLPHWRGSSWNIRDPNRWAHLFCSLPQPCASAWVPMLTERLMHVHGEAPALAESLIGTFI